MKAELLERTRLPISENEVVHTRIWRVASPVRGSAHLFKYSLVLVVDGECALRYDNEAGKGDHKHIGDQELPYTFNGLDQMIDDFWRDIEAWRKR